MYLKFHLKYIISFIIISGYLLYFTNTKTYAQKLPDEAIHTETVKMNSGYSKVNILDCSKKKIKTKQYLMYYWFLDDNIHFSIGGYSGKLLHGLITTFYNTDNLKEQGVFNYGLKVGLWKNWYNTGALKSITTYRHGVRDGLYKEFDEEGNMNFRYRYCNGLIQGKYITYKDCKKLSVVHYKKGVAKVAKMHTPKIKKKDTKQKITKNKKCKLPKISFKKMFEGKKK